MPRRQRLHRGEPDGAHLPRGSAEQRLGGHVEHDVHGRAPRNDEGRPHDQALFDEVRPLAGQDARYDAMVQHTELLVREAVEDEFFARPMTEAVARLLQGAELMRHSTQEVVDVFLGTRGLRASSTWGSHYGTLATIGGHARARSIVQRASIN